ncbi:MAG: purine-nucleoside phosphorylase [Verrucomicrobiales bacterium]|jgi:purine-nucleoside phosphorylase
MNEFTKTALPATAQNQIPKVGIVLGSGLGSFVDRLEIEAELPYSEIDGLPKSAVPGHAGKFIFGKLNGLPVVVAQGRVHLYEGYPAKDVCAGVRVMAAMGIDTLVLTNAAGSTNPKFAPGNWMQLSDQLNLSGQTPLLGGPNFIDMSAIYDPELRAAFHSESRRQGLQLYQGVYASVLGPQYETPAEVRMLGKLGADAVGMSTALEAIQARALGLKVAGFSCLTNWGSGLSDQPLSHNEVLETGLACAGQLVELLAATLENLV